MTRTKWNIFAAIGLFALLSGCAAKVEQTGFLSTYANLQPVQGQEETFLRYIGPPDELSLYSTIIVDPVAVRFYDQEGTQNIKPEDLEHIQQFFYAQLCDNLQAAGFHLATDPGTDVARLRVAITNLKASTPALNVLPQTKLTGLGLGQLSAEFELVDSQTGRQLAAAIKSETGSRFSLSGLSRWGDVEAVIKDWSKRIAERLASVHSEMKGS